MQQCCWSISTCDTGTSIKNQRLYVGTEHDDSLDRLVGQVDAMAHVYLIERSITHSPG